ncbi:hypothetical protein [Methanoculleus sp.]|nr:hypothetical protein [Methanoculleus sp.]MBP7144702.1 hypothetical protein [Methanoculleus sp.]HNT09073.1 hypothetical protein [Methanoculleus sp.]
MKLQKAGIRPRRPRITPMEWREKSVMNNRSEGTEERNLSTSPERS